MIFTDVKKYLIFLIFLICIGSLLILFFSSSVYIKLIFITILIPLILGMLLQEFILGIGVKELINRLYTLVYVIIIPILGIYLFTPEVFQSPGDIFIFYSTIYTIALLAWSVFSHEIKYVPKINIEITYIYIAMFFYWLGGMMFFSLGTIYIGLILAVYQKTKFKFIEWVLSLSYGVISLTFWYAYVLYIYEKYGNVFKFEGVQISNLFVVGEFFILGISIGYVFQTLCMLWVYFPEKNNFYGKRQRKNIRRVNKLLLDRFDEKDVSIVSIFISIFLLTILVAIHNATLFVPIELFIGLVFIILSIGSRYLSFFIKK